MQPSLWVTVLFPIAYLHVQCQQNICIVIITIIDEASLYLIMYSYTHLHTLHNKHTLLLNHYPIYLGSTMSHPWFGTPTLCQLLLPPYFEKIFPYYSLSTSYIHSSLLSLTFSASWTHSIYLRPHHIPPIAFMNSPTLWCFDQGKSRTFQPKPCYIGQSISHFPS